MKDAKDDLGGLGWSEAEQRAAQGNTRFVRELGSQLADRYAVAAEEVREYDRQLAHVVRVLALTPGRDSLAELLQFLDEKRPPGYGAQPRFVASLLAEHHQAPDLASTVFDRSKWDRLDDLRACLFHELLLRGVDIDSFPPLRSWPGAQPGWHPLAWLPAERSEMEANVDFPTRSMTGSASGVPGGLSLEGRMDPPTPRSPERSLLRDIATADVRESIVAAVQAGDWGHFDAWVFMLEDPITPEGVPALLPTLPMPCVEGLGTTGRFQISRRRVDEIWRLLFATASMGGMGTSGVQAAFGRLWAWRSIAGLSGTPESASAEEVECQAWKCTWFHFEADGDWFNNEIGSDYGIATLSPDCRRLAVLAATDTD